MKKTTWCVGAQAECQDCDWRSSNWINAQAVGAKHAKHHNHFVRVETVLVSYYNYPEGTFRSSKVNENRDGEGGHQERGSLPSENNG